MRASYESEMEGLAESEERGEITREKRNELFEVLDQKAQTAEIEYYEKYGLCFNDIEREKINVFFPDNCIGQKLAYNDRDINNDRWKLLPTYKYDFKTETCSNFCGNNITDEGEECDDGNLVDGDGCSSLCKVTVIPFILYILLWKSIVEYCR